MADLVLTNDGLSCLNYAQTGGLKLDVTQFRVWRTGQAANALPYTATTTETLLGAPVSTWILCHTGVPTEFDPEGTNTVRVNCAMDENVGDFEFDAIGLLVDAPAGFPGYATGEKVLLGIYAFSSLVEKNQVGNTDANTIDTTLAINYSQVTGLINITITNVKYTYNFIPEVNDLSSLPVAQTTASRMYRLTRNEGLGSSGVNSYLVHAAKVAFAPQGYQSNEWIPDSHSLVWHAGELKLQSASGGGFTSDVSHVIISLPETTPLGSARIPNPHNGLVITFYENSDANQGLVRNVSAVNTSVSGGTEYIELTLSQPLPNAPTAGARFKLWSPSGVGGASVAGGGGAGDNLFHEATATDSGDGHQYVLSTGSVRAEQCLLFVAPAYVPESLYTVTGTNQITMIALHGIPVGVKYQAVERARYGIPGGNTGQVLTKVSPTNYDYDWQDAAAGAYPGMTFMWPTPVCPPWALVRDGSQINRSTYAALFALLCPTVTYSSVSIDPVQDGLSYQLSFSGIPIAYLPWLRMGLGIEVDSINPLLATSDLTYGNNAKLYIQRIAIASILDTTCTISVILSGAVDTATTNALNAFPTGAGTLRLMLHGDANAACTTFPLPNAHGAFERSIDSIPNTSTIWGATTNVTVSTQAGSPDIYINGLSPFGSGSRTRGHLSHIARVGGRAYNSMTGPGGLDILKVRVANSNMSAVITLSGNMSATSAAVVTSLASVTGGSFIQDSVAAHEHPVTTNFDASNGNGYPYRIGGGDYAWNGSTPVVNTSHQNNYGYETRPKFISCLPIIVY